MVQQTACRAQGADALLDVAVLEPLILPKAASSIVQVVIEEDQFSVHSLSGDFWKLHAQGRIAKAPAREQSLAPGSAQPMSNARVHYARMEAQGAGFGPAFQTIQALHVEPGLASAYVRLQDSEKMQAARYRIHPALLDGCLQLIAAAADRDGLYLPFGVDRFESFHNAGAEAWATVRLLDSQADDVLTADIDIRDKKGLLLARVGGARMKLRAGRTPPLYQVEWQRMERVEAAVRSRGRWVVVTGVSEAAGQLAAALRAAGLETKIVKPTDALCLDAGVAGVIHLVDPSSEEELVSSQRRGWATALAITQQIVRSAVPSPPQLWLVTRDAVATAPADLCDGLLQAPVWGMARTIALEHPELRCVSVDLDSSSNFRGLAQEIANWDGEQELAFRAGVRLVPRLVAKLSSGRQPLQWTIPAQGRIDGLVLQGVERRAPGPGEVEVEIEASALNFRDVLTVLGLYPGDPVPLGLEFVGRVVAIGEGVSGCDLGARVMGLAFGSFATFVTTAAALMIPVPAGLSPLQAVSLPNAFLTAHHCLNHLGHLLRGERVLIHAATGGVGLAAVQLARLAGAEIFATAGSEEKRELPSRARFSSRIRFAEF